MGAQNSNADSHEPLLPHRQARLDRGLRISLGLHLGVLLLGFGKSILFPSTPKLFIPAVRVDLVGLPQVKKSDLDQLAERLNEPKSLPQEDKPSAQKMPTPPQADDPNSLSLRSKPPQEKSRNLSHAIDRIRAIQELEKQASNTSKREKAAPYLGNQISHGTERNGASDGEINLYVSELKTRIQSRWDLPVWLKQQGFRAQVALKLDAQGQVAQLLFTKPSGSDQYDNYVKSAILRSAPFPAPPADLMENGLLIGFPL